MKTALVFGGTRFFGVNLVQSLLQREIKVTIATRQHTEIPFGPEVEKIKVDRFDLESMQEATEGRSWDFVFDQICYNADDASIAVEVLEGKVGKYIFTSTQSVYDYGANLAEDMFNPTTYQFSKEKNEKVNYQEGKRQAEAVFYQKADFPVTAVRLPIVLGEHDYTGRLQLHIDHIKTAQPLGFYNLDAEIGFIHQEEAGAFIAWIAEQNFTGPINACANGTLTLDELIKKIQHTVNKEAIIQPSTFMDQGHSPYGIEKTWTMSNEKASALGYTFSTLEEWLPNLIEKLSSERV
ncbi:NAD-dependent epimerase/dehydratase family protein [Longirhabdus pacifica]|uniref:NAD-dependent epimerase/dehydratase family protein n=1 Tax=Longirhabdus pacifica TaxID=2305227 RepID=UPI00100878AF|nr:NAD-dependent epimerase/dehydratase family protein [Longirhabdus pacifica]